MSRIISVTTKLNCDSLRAFEMFTMNELLESWLTVRADVEPKVGGKYELFWKPEDRMNDSTIGCKITGLEPDKFLSFDWKGPKKFRRIMNDCDPLTHVVIFFLPFKGKSGEPITEVCLIHSGWGSTPEWEEARVWFEKAWRDAFNNLKKLAEK